MYIDLVTINLCPGQGGGGVKPSGTLDIVENGVYNVYSYSSASVDVHPSISLSETYISNGSYNITGEFNGGVITVDVPAPQFVTETLNVSVNGTYTPSEGVNGYSQVVVDVPISGWDQKSFTEELIKFINIDNSASFVASSAFRGNQTIKTVNLPYATTVNQDAFRECASLLQVSLPMCSYIGVFAFGYCYSLSQVSLPVCSRIDAYAFNNCSSLSQVSLPMCSYISDNVFNTCSSLSQVSLPVCSRIEGGAFGQCYSLSQISLPVCSRIGNGVFQNCYSLSQVSLPVCKNISAYAFSGCSSLNSLTLCTDVYWTIPYNNNILSGTPIMSGTGSIYVRSDTYSAWITSNGWSSLSDRFVSIETSGFALSFSEGTVYGTTKLLYDDFLSYLGVSKSDITKVVLPECIYIENSAFYSYSLLSQVSLPMCSYIGASAFYRCYSLSQVNLPVCSYIENNAFYGCSSLSQVNLPVCSYISNSVFFNCFLLSQVSIPLCEYIGSGAFRTCSLLSLSLPVCSYIGGLAFYGCSSLSIITIGYSGICSLGDARVFETTQITSSTGSIYVPASLVDAYKSANYWSHFSNRIFPIE